MYYSFIRVSTKDQKLDRQIDALTEYCKANNIIGCKYYGTKTSGKDLQAFQKFKTRLRSGDTLILHSIDRLGRNYDQIIDEWRWMEKHNISVIVLDMPILSSTQQGLDNRFLSNLVLQILSYVAEKEREKIKQRQMEGIESAKARGVKFGRPKKQFNIQAVIDYCNNGYCDSAKYIALFGGAKASFFRAVRNYIENRL